MSKLSTSKLLFIVLFGSISLVSQGNAQNVDPTKPFSGVTSTASGEQKKALVLESIIHGDGIHTVVINGKKLQVGDTIGEHRLVAVNDASVVLRSDTERLKLHVFSSVIVK